ncbi:UDP-glucose flavonoid 3-O-glucosyltransferase 6 [Vitis vinifera]|uniref:UDP-glucose flavonoid 3-O-glucosyltransferase 6 n=1 Tax=Vitis vinifera TaxID=29760 RepID=A0A438HCK9_VITVI|nr:UDP-glucose flavonoid 3-O-glucosyltransferase 6 [Vitis vinifera]
MTEILKPSIVASSFNKGQPQIIQKRQVEENRLNQQSYDVSSSPAKTIESNRWLVMKQTELVFIPSPGIGHLAATVEIAKLLTQRDPRFSITIFIIKFPFWSDDISMTSDSDSIRYLTLPPV